MQKLNSVRAVIPIRDGPGFCAGDYVDMNGFSCILRVAISNDNRIILHASASFEYFQRKGSFMQTKISYRFDPPDMVQVNLLRKLTPSQRIQLMLDARALAVGLIRGRLSKHYPDLPPNELNLKVLEKLSHAR